MLIYDMPVISLDNTDVIAQVTVPKLVQPQKMQAITLDWGWILPSDPQYSYEPGHFAADLAQEACGALLQGFKFKYLNWTSPTCKLIGIVTQPKHGVLIDEGNGAYGFKPKPGYLGKDGFQYVVEGIDGRRVLVTMPIWLKTMAEAFSFYKLTPVEQTTTLAVLQKQGELSPTKFYQNTTDEAQVIALLAQAQLPKADRVVKECRAVEDGANVIPGDDAKYLFVKWLGRAPQDLSWQKEWNALSILSVFMVEKPSKGKVKTEGTDSRGDNGYTYIPPSPEFSGTDRFSFLVKLSNSNSKSVLMRYQMEPGSMDTSFSMKKCIFTAQLRQTQLSPAELMGFVSTPSFWLRKTQLSALLASASQAFTGFQDQAGFAVGNTVGKGSDAVGFATTAQSQGSHFAPDTLDALIA